MSIPHRTCRLYRGTDCGNAAPNFVSQPTFQHRAGLRAVAVIEFFKGLVVLALAVFFFSLMHGDAEGKAATLLRSLHLNAESHFPRLFLETVGDLKQANWPLLVLLGLGYVSLRFLEAGGLWHGRRWAEWLGAVSGAVYIPFELYELARSFTPLKLGVLAVNLAVVAYLVWVLVTAPPKPAAANGTATAVVPPPP